MNTCTTIYTKKLVAFVCTLAIACCCFTASVNAQQLPLVKQLTTGNNMVLVQNPGSSQLLTGATQCNCSSFSVCITSQVNNTCYGSNYGSATASASGGSQPYSYSWNTNPVQKTAKATGLADGTYTVTVTDGMGCTATACVTITGGTPITIVITGQPTSNSCSGYFSVTQGGWGTACHGGNPGCYRDAHFATCFPNGLTIGCTNTYTFTSSSAIQNFLPSGGTPSALPSGNATNPTSAGNTFAGQLVAATLNVGFDNCDPNFASATGNLGNLLIASGPFAGWSVNQVIALANQVIGGCSTAYSTSDLTNALDGINSSYDGGTATGFLVCPSSICNSSCETLTICGTSCTTYKWSPSNGLSTSTGTSVIACPTVTTTYTVTGTDKNGCTGTGTIVVTVNPPTTITINTPAPICIGNCATLTINGAPCISYTWSPSTGLSATTGSSVQACPTVTTTYTVTGSDHNGCPATGKVVVTVNTTTTITINTPAPICSGNCATLTVNGTPCTSYTWAPSTGLNKTTGSSIQACPTVTTTYTVTGSDHNGCPATGTVIVTVNPTTTITVNAPAPICKGNCATLTVNGAPCVSYTWSPSAGLSATTGSSVQACPTTTTTYTVTGSDHNGCPATGTVVVTVNPTTTITVNTPAPICLGSCATLTVNGAPCISYTWSPSTGLSATTGSSVQACPTTTTTYTVTGSDHNGCPASGTVVVTVNTTTTITVNTPAPICSGNCATLTVNGAPCVSYTWSPSTGLSATTGSSIQACPTVTTTYTVTGSDHNGCPASGTVVVTVNTPSVISSSPAKVCAGNCATLTVTGANTYTWSPSTGLSATTGSSVQACPTGTTTYTITGTNSNNCVSTTTTTVTVYPLPVLSSSPATVCAGNCATLTVTGASTYTWSPSTGLSATTGSSVQACPTATTTYTITGRNSTDLGNGCSSTTTTVVHVNPLPNVTVVATKQTVCSGTSDTLTASGATGYTWTPSAGLSATTGSVVYANPTVNTTYTVTGTNPTTTCSNTATIAVNVYPSPTVAITVSSASLCNGAADTLTASGGTTYTWSPSVGLNVTTGSQVIATPTVSTTYTVIGISNVGCTSLSAGFTAITVNNPPVLTSAPATICSGSCANLTVTGADTYTWSPSTGLNATTGSSVQACPTATTTYTITGTTTAGCVGTTTTVVTVNYKPVITVQPRSNTMCAVNGQCDGHTFCVTATGINLSYQWYFKGQPIPGANQTCYSFSPGTFADTGKYFVTVSNQCGTDTSDTVIFILINQPEITSPPANVSVCLGNSAQFCVQATGTALNYQWQFKGKNITNANDTCFTIPSTSLSDTGTYDVIVSGLCGADTAYAKLTVDTIKITVNSAVICYGNSAVLTASGAATYTWSPAAGLSATTGSSVTANPTANTTYTVTGTSGKGCVGTAIATVKVNPLPVLSSSPATVCAGNCAQLTVTGARSYTWSPSTGLSVTTGSAVQACPTATTTYTITGINNGDGGDGCIGTTTTVVTVDTLPVIVVPPATICNGNSAILTASGATTYTWSPATGLSATTGATVLATPTATTTYTITGVNGNSCSGSTSTVVHVNPIPVLSASPARVCKGTCTPLTVTGASFYTWSPSTGLSATTGSSVQACPTVTTTYTITGTSTSQCVGTTTVKVTVDTLPVIVAPPATICNGNSAILTATGATTYTWSPATGLSATTGSSVIANPTASTTYTVTGINGNGCTGSTSTVVHVNPIPVLSASPARVCKGTCTPLTVTGASFYTWSPSTGLSATTGSSVQACPTATTTYTITGTSTSQCVGTTTVIVTVDTLPVIVAPPATICSGNSATLTATGATTYTWSPATGLSATTGSSVIANPTASTTYTVTGINGNGCTGSTSTVVHVNPIPVLSASPARVCKGTCAPLTVTGASFYTWSPSTGLSATTGSSVQACPTVTTTYTITGTSTSQCVGTTTTIVTVDTLPVIAAPPATICSGNSAKLTATGANTYTWSPATGLSATTGSSVIANPTATTTYTIVGINGNGCTGSTTTIVTVDTLPVIVVPPARICSGNSTQLTATGATTYTWSPATGLSATTGASVLATPTATTTYTITGANGNNCSSSTTTIVTVDTLPVIVAPPARICSGNSTELTASGAATYTWSPATGLSATTGASVLATPTATTTYTVTGVNGNGCTGSTTTIVTVDTLPVIVANPGRICSGNSTELTASGATTYTWSPATGLSATTGATVTASPTATTTYTIVGINGNGCTGSTTTIVRVDTLPILSAPAAEVCIGSCAQLSVTGATSYTWSPAAGLSATTGASVLACPTASTTYTIVGTNGNGCVATTTTTVKVDTLPVLKLTANPNPICLGNSTTITATGAVTYTWSPATGLSATTGSSVIANPTATTTYRVIGTNSNGCVCNDSIVIIVHTPPVLVSLPATVCVGQCAPLTVTGAATYTWSPATGLSATTGSSVTACPTANTTYTITGINDNGCVGTTTTSVTVDTLPVITLVQSADSICVGSTDTIWPSGATSYTWKPAVFTLEGLPYVVVSPTVTTTYTVTGTNGNGCTDSTTFVVTVDTLPVVIVPPARICSGNSTELTASGATTYTWSPATGLSATTGATVLATPTATTTYTIVGTNSHGCSASTTTIVTVDTIPVIVVPPAIICSGNSAQLTATGANTYTWSPATGLSATTGSSVIANPTATTTYTIVGINGNGCTGSTTTIVTVDTLPVIVVPPARICSGNSTELTASGATTYTWSPATGLSATTGASVLATPTATTTYTITGANGNNCSSSTTTIVTVDTLPVIVAPPARICSGNSTELTASGAATYTWSPATGLSATTGASVLATPTATTTYTVTGVNGNGCTGSTTTIVTVDTLPVIVAPPATICYGNSTELTASGAATYTWSPATGLSATTGASVLATPTATTTYTIVGINGNGCTGSTTTVVTVDTLPVIVVPPARICSGNSTELTASGATTYTWSPAIGLSATTGATVLATPTATTTYTIVGINGNGCTGSTTTIVTVDTLPVIVAPPATICSGKSTQLTASGAVTYTWNPATGLSATTGATVTATPTATTTYTVTGTNGNGCTGSTTTIVTVDSLPVITVPSATICDGNSTVLSVNGGNGSSIFELVLPDTAFHSDMLDSRTPAMNRVGFPEFDAWHWTVSSVPTIGRSVVSYNLNAIPVGSTIINASLSLYGDSTSSEDNGGSYSSVSNASYLQLLTTPWNPSTVTWNTQPDTTTTDEVFLAKSTSEWENYLNINVTALISDLYNNPTTYTGIMLRLQDENPVYDGLVFGSSTNSDVHNHPRLVITYSTKGGSNNSNTYTWSPSTGLSATTGSSVTANPTVTTTYTIIAVNANGCSDTTTTVVTVDTLPVIVVPPARICSGNSTQLTATGATTYTWSPATGLSATTGASVLATPTATTTYTITGANGNNCSSSTTTIVTVDTLPVIVAPPARICSGNSTELTASGAATYTWSPATGLSATTGASVLATPTATTTYTVTGVNGNGCTGNTTTIVTVDTLPVIVANPGRICSGNSTELTASGATTYTWSPATGLSATTGATVTASPTATTTYTIVGINGNGCTGSTTTIVRVDTLPILSAPAAEVCIGSCAQLSVSGATSYTWSPAAGLSATTGASVLACPTASTTYTIVGTNGNGCVATTTTTVKVDTLPVLKLTANPNPICLGNSTTITATGAVTYTWSPATGLSATTGSSVIANPTATTTYRVIGTNSNGCVCNDSIVIIVHTPPVLVSLPATVCVGQCAPLTVTGAATYTWSPATGLSATTGSSVTACPTANTTYTITGINDNGCVGTTTTSVTVDTLPKITVTLSADSICVGSTDTVRPSGASSYTWKPAVFTLEGLPYVVVSPTVTTTYTVTGTNGNGCTDSTTFVVKVNPPTLITLQLKNDTVCVGNSATFTVAATGQNLTYTWQKNGVTIAGTSPTLTIPSVALSDSGIYDVIVSGTCGADTSYGTLKVNQAPAITKINVNGDTINVNDDTTVALCANFSQSFNVTITVGGQNLTYQWFHNGSAIPNDTTLTLNINNVTVTDGGTYKVVVYGPCGNDTSVTVDLNINSNTLVGSLTINDSTVTSNLDTISTCLGSSATFTVNATGTNLTYQWQFNGSNIPTATSATYIIPVTKLTDAGLYDVIVTGTCNADTVYAPLKIDTKPTITGQPSSVSMCATNCKAGGVLFCVTATGVNLTYQWQFKGNNITGANSACYGLSPATCSDTGSYRVIVTNQCGADTSNVARLELYGAPVITGQPQCATICAGGSAQFCVTATGTGITYQWYFNGSKILNATSSCYTASNAGCYSVVVSNSCNSVCSNIVTLTVNTPPVITCQPKGESLCSVGGKCGGNGVTFCVTATGSNLTYQWQYNYKNISGAHSSCYTIYPVVAADSGNYRVIVSNSCGADTSNCAILTIGSAPVITYQPQCATVCSGNTAQFCVTATGKGLTYQWQYNGKNINSANSSCYTAHTAGCYDVVVTNSCGSVTSCIVTLTINTPPVITCQPKGESLCSVGGKCGGNGVTFCVTATGSNLTYQWQFNGTNIRNATSSCYTINPVYTTSAGSYRVIVSNSCGADTSNCAILTIGSAPCITAQPVCTTVCAGNSATFCVTATGTGLTYQWQLNGKNISGANSCCYTIPSAATCNAGCYDVVVSNSCGSVTSCIVTLTVNTPPCITSQPVCATTCSGNNTTFCVTANGSNLTYQWQYNGKNISGAHSCCYTACNAGCYDVVVSNSCGSVTSNTVTLTVGTPPSITYQPLCTTVCAGNTATFCVTAVGTGLSYQWQYNGKNISGANSCCYTIPSAASCNAGCYDVVICNSCGSVTSCTVTLTVNTPPCITTQPVCLTVCAGSSSTFSVTANGSNLTYQWQYKGKNISNANSSTYTVSSATTSDAGNYDVVVSNGCGCVTSTVVTLTVNNCSTCNTPTNLCASNITCTGAKLSWSYSSSASSFTVEYRVHGCSTWTTVKVTTNCLTLTCLNSGTTYDWSVSENCSCGSSSSYAGVVSFCTSNNCCGNNLDVDVKKVDDVSAINDLKIYPNPTFSTATIQGNFDKESNITLLITDLSGRILMTENETAPAGDYIHQFDMSNQPQGTYFLIIKNGDKMVTSRIVKIQ